MANSQNQRAERGLPWAAGWRKWADVGQRGHIIKETSSGDLRRNVVVMVNYTVAYTCQLLGVDLKQSHHKKRNSNYVL